MAQNHRMKKRLTVVLLFACLLLIFTACSEGGAPAGMQKVDCTGLPYHTYLPDQWEVRQANGHLEACVSSSTPVAITVRHFEIKETDVNDYWQKTQAELETSYADFKLEENPTAYDICGQSGTVVSFSGKQGEHAYRFLQAMTLKDGTLYLVTYSARTNVKTGTDLYATYLDDAYRVIDNMTFAEKESEGGTSETPAVNEKGMIEIGDAKTKGWRVDLFAPRGWIDESYGTFAFARDPETNSSLSLCMEQTDATDFSEYWEGTVAELKTLYPDSEFAYEDASDEEDATVGDTEKLVYTECSVSSLRGERIDYVLVTKNARYRCVKIAAVGGYKLYVLTFTFPEGKIEGDQAEKVVGDVLSSLKIK